jgi:DivIVA domain-containing protein
LALDRQTIEKRDFPIGRRGYDIAAVDAHLAMLAEEFDALRQEAERSAGQDAPLAGAASEQVRLIVQAAEQSAAQIEREAEADARRTREDAGRDATEHVSAVSEASRSMLERVEAMQHELGELMESLRAGAGRVDADLSQLSSDVAQVRGLSGGTPAAELPAAGDTSAPAGEDVVDLVPGEVAEEPAPEPPAEAVDEEGARLIALNMALSGTPREETERYLSDHFEMPDPDGLLDDVYARAGQ